VFKSLIDDAKSAAASFVGTYLARASVAVPFLVALGLATAAVGLELTERFGARSALWLLAGGFCAVGLLAAFAVTVKEQQEMVAAEERQQPDEAGVGEMTSAAAAQAATQLPAALLGALMQGSSLSSLSDLPVGRTVGRHMPLVLLLLLVALLLWPTEEAEESTEQEGGSEASGPDRGLTGGGAIARDSVTMAERGSAYEGDSSERPHLARP
jgi:hypothetical protein